MFYLSAFTSLLSLFIYQFIYLPVSLFIVLTSVFQRSESGMTFVVMVQRPAAPRCGCGEAGRSGATVNRSPDT